MQPSSDQFNFQIDSPEYTTGTADVVEKIDLESQTERKSERPAEINHGTGSKEDRIAKATMYALEVMEQGSTSTDTIEKPSQPGIQEYMKQISHMGVILDVYREQELNK